MGFFSVWKAQPACVVVVGVECEGTGEKDVLCSRLRYLRRGRSLYCDRSCDGVSFC